MKLIKTYAMLMTCVAMSLYSADLTNGLAADYELKVPNTSPANGALVTVDQQFASLPVAATGITINGKAPAELLASGELLKLVRKVPIQIPATRDDTGDEISIPATQDEIIGYVFSIPTTQDSQQTVALDYRQTAPGAFAVNVGSGAFENKFHPKDPREILVEMYAKGEEFKMPFVIENDSISSDPSIFMHDDRIQISAQEFKLTHGTVIASPFPLQFALKSNPVISQIAITGRPFYKELEGIPVCFNATLLKMIGNHGQLHATAAFVGALHRPAMEVLFAPSIISPADLQIYLAAQQAKQEEAARAAADAAKVAVATVDA